jgi:hypothetical protein
LSRLPADRRQPNLLFASARYLLGGPVDVPALRAVVTADAAGLAAVMRRKSTQTNEPGRCAALLPALATIGGPLALVEVGASAGLCLNIAQYSYDYGTHHLHGADPEAPTLSCKIVGGAPKLTMPDVLWTAGIDLNPLDPSDPEDRSWLECLVWPDQPERAAQLIGALDTAVRSPVAVHRGDLLTKLSDVLDQAPPNATPVVFHSAVLAYLTPESRAEFADLLQTLDVVWVANEAPGVAVDAEPPLYDTAPFVLSVNGDRVAYTHPHGDWIDWTA